MKHEVSDQSAGPLTARPTNSGERKPIDMHVHIVGNGAGGSGCRLHLSGWHKPLASMMLKGIGLPKEALTGDLEGLYVAKLLEWVRGSSLGAIVILAQDEVRNEKGEVMHGVGSFYVPNDYVLKLARENAEFLPAVSIHPARPDAMEELERCLAEGAVMMKCLPNCQNINCGDKKFTKFWERMAEAKLPLLAHTGGEHTVPVVRKEFANPRILELPLRCGVTVIAAHCATKSGLTDPEYFYDFAKMTEEFPNLYGDTSAFNVPLRGRHIDKCVLRPLVERMVHGSDVPVPVSGIWAWMRGYLDWDSLQKWGENPNVLERDYQLKLAMGFPMECFTRIHDIMRPVGKNSPK
ncbi:amidohydrolase family protein [Pedosphaera parvula]|nr:amidohydrolase family protein [Pedosphaera parvula]